MSGKDSTKGKERGRVKEQGRAEVCQKREVVEERFKEAGENWRGHSSLTKAEEWCEIVVSNKRAIHMSGSIRQREKMK